MKTTNGRVRRGLFLLPILASLMLPGLSHAAASAALIQRPAFTCGSGIREQHAVRKTTFESVPSRPMALSDDGSLLYVINSQANCLEIYQTTPTDLKLVSTVVVGIGPVSVAVRSASFSRSRSTDGTLVGVSFPTIIGRHAPQVDCVPTVSAALDPASSPDVSS